MKARYAQSVQINERLRIPNQSTTNSRTDPMINKEDIKTRIQARLKEKKERQKICEACPNYRKPMKYTPPRYDEVYYRGVEWLDSL